MIPMTSLVRLCGIASLSALSITTYFNLPSYAQSTTFFCAVNKGVPVTYARTPRGKVPMIRWRDDFGGAGLVSGAVQMYLKDFREITITVRSNRSQPEH